MDVKKLAKELVGGDRRALAKSITLIESSLTSHRGAAEELLTKLMPKTGASVRVGISGVPGVGKSTFIESLGMQLIKAGNRLAVLAIDPSSPVTGGSILGDKTRMEQLAVAENAFIRPTPSAGALGGVARHTREAVLLCEAAGFDIVLVETVGVGQSEVLVSSMVDVFLMLQLPNAGDELQGIKKGILELADVVAVTKADGAHLKNAMKTKLEQERALHLVRGHQDWEPPVILCSGLSGEGVDKVWGAIEDFVKRQRASKALQQRRRQQSESWFESEVNAQLLLKLNESKSIRASLEKARADVAAQKILPSVAASKIISKFFD